ncbi:MAG: NUDIX hydrolase [Chloroflexi bacterium]|nr:NUDIX hydrolase [Chloroflexota bacterium]
MNEVLSSRIIYQGRVVGLRVDTIRSPKGRLLDREVVEHRGSAAIVPLDDEGNVLLVRQYRAAVEEYLVEVPAGTLEPGEAVEVCVQRELQEETGFIAGQIEHIVGFYPSPGFCTEYMDVYLATKLVPSRLPPDEDEAIEVLKVPLDKAWQMVQAGEIRDAKTLIGLLYTRLHIGSGT